MKLSLFALAVVAALCFAGSARAHPGYPRKVDDAFGISIETIDPTMGCQLCHTSSAGATLSLRPFGQRLVSMYGLDDTATENDQSLAQALQGLKAGDPQLVQDLQKGLDPNADVINDPTPQYGCAVGRAAGGSLPGTSLAVGLVLALALVRRSITAAARR